MITDYSIYPKKSAEPEASSMIQSFRAIGYNIQTAVADIIDNSISAGARNIWIDFEWKGKDTWFSIEDDGHGMSDEELVLAMRPGSKSPEEPRPPKDLGRFGLGLKTASFSQCRQLTVISRKKDNPEKSFWTWDLDFVTQSGNWNLIKYCPPEQESSLDQLPSGTTVVWNMLDRVVRNMKADDDHALDKFLQIMEVVKFHLGMVFHRYINNNIIKLFFRQREIPAWDPFLPDNIATKKFPEEPLLNKRIRIKGFVLPHKSKLTEDDYKKAEGPKGWNNQQGFYVYRNQRLILAGDWLGMFRKEETYKLARIMVDLPNDLDGEWQIDIKKSVARPPHILRDQLKAYATRIREHAVQVYRHKGQVLQRKYSTGVFSPVWNEKIKGGKRYYEINREHPVIKEACLHKNETLTIALKLLEEALPIPLIVLNESENPDSFKQPYEESDREDILDVLKLTYKNLLNNYSKIQAKDQLYLIEPFNRYPELIESL